MSGSSSGRQIVLIVGNGRSGTNWLMRMLDAHPDTFCRSEPLDIASSPIQDLPDPLAMEAGADDAMAEAWDRFVDWTVAHAGERDLPFGAPKSYLTPWVQRLGVLDLHKKQRLRRIMEAIVPRYRQAEWAIPAPFLREEAFAQAPVVIKINGLPAWHCKWLLEHRPEVRVVHIVRHLGGSLHSASNRFFERLGPDQLDVERKLYADHVRHAIEHDATWADLAPDPDHMTAVEALGWSWRYHNEEILEAGEGLDHYRLVVYERVTASPIAEAEALYEFCGFEFDAAVAARVEAGLSTNNWRDLSGSPEAVAARWRADARPEILGVVDAVLPGSKLAPLW